MCFTFTTLAKTHIVTFEAIYSQINCNGMIFLPEDIVDTNNTVGSGRSRVMDYGCIGLHPNPAAVFCEESIIFGRHLSFI